MIVKEEKSHDMKHKEWQHAKLFYQLKFLFHTILHIYIIFNIKSKGHIIMHCTSIYLFVVHSTELVLVM